TLRVYGSLLRHRVFMVHTLAGGLASAGLFAYVTGSSLIFIELFKIPVERFGIYFSLNALGLIAASQVNGYIAHHIDPRRTVRTALLVATIAGAALTATATTG